MSDQLSPRRLWTVIAGSGRATVFRLTLLGVGLAYIAFAFLVGSATTTSERHFGATTASDPRQLGVYVEVIAVDAVNDALRLRISFTPGAELRGGTSGTSARDLKLLIGDGDTVQDLTFRAHERMASVTFEADLSDGAVASYPLDRYRTSLRVAAHEPDETPVPLRATVWDGVAGWTVDVTPTPGGDPADIRLQIGVRRGVALQWLALTLYGEMALVAFAALSIARVVFLRIRPAESTLISALAGMLFALPAMRYAMPGTPPLGVRGDLLVFLWAELALALSLTLFIIAWARPNTRS